MALKTVRLVKGDYKGDLAIAEDSLAWNGIYEVTYKLPHPELPKNTQLVPCSFCENA